MLKLKDHDRNDEITAQILKKKKKKKFLIIYQVLLMQSPAGLSRLATDQDQFHIDAHLSIDLNQD